MKGIDKMTKAQKVISELEVELTEYSRKLGNLDISKMQHPAKQLASIVFYQAQAFKKIFERLDDIESKL